MKKLNIGREYLLDSAKEKTPKQIDVADVDWQKVKTQHPTTKHPQQIIRFFEDGQMKVLKGAALEGSKYLRMDDFELLKEAFKELRQHGYKTHYALSVSNERLRDTYSVEEKTVAFNRNYKKSALRNGILYLGWRGDQSLIILILKNYGLDAFAEGETKKIQIKIVTAW